MVTQKKDPCCTNTVVPTVDPCVPTCSDVANWQTALQNINILSRRINQLNTKIDSCLRYGESRVWSETGPSTQEGQVCSSGNINVTGDLFSLEFENDTCRPMGIFTVFSVSIYGKVGGTLPGTFEFAILRNFLGSAIDVHNPILYNFPDAATGADGETDFQRSESDAFILAPNESRTMQVRGHIQYRLGTATYTTSVGGFGIVPHITAIGVSL